MFSSAYSTKFLEDLLMSQCHGRHIDRLPHFVVELDKILHCLGNSLAEQANLYLALDLISLLLGNPKTGSESPHAPLIPFKPQILRELIV